MPEGQLPVENFGDYTNTPDLQVYYKLSAQETEWIVSTDLIVLNYGTTNGSTLGSASLVPLMLDNDSTRPDYDSEVRAVKIDAQDIYFVNTQGGSSGPYYIRVTDKQNGVEFPIFFGYVNSVPNSLVPGRCAAGALSYAGLLNSQDLVGAWYHTGPATNAWKSNVEPIFNPDGNGNKGSETITVGSITAPAINQTKIIETETTDNMFTVSDIINVILLHLVSTAAVFDDGISPSVQPWYWAKFAYHTDLIEITPDAQELLAAAFVVDNYSYYGKSVWRALTELVDSVGNLVLSEKINYLGGITEKPKLLITKVS